MSKPLFNNIKINDYLEPIRKLEEYYKDVPVTYYSDILKKYKNIRVLNKNHEDILLQYLQCRPNAKIIVAFSDHDVTATKNKLKKESNFYYHKSVTMSKKEIIALIYQLLYDECSTYQNLKNYTEKLGFKDENKLEVYFYENTFFEKESMVKENKKKNVIEEATFDDGIDHFTNDSFDELILMSSIFLNENSLELLRMQNIERLYKFNKKDKKNLNNFKLFIEHFSKLSLLERQNLMLTSGIVLYIYGLRKYGDFDIFYLKEFSKLNNKNRLSLDVAKVMEYFPDFNVNGEKVSLFEAIVDPKYHMYFLGIKCNTLDFDMRIRFERKNKPRAYVDIIMVNLIYNKEYKVPIKENKFDKQFYKTLRFFFKNRYGKNFDNDYIKDLISKFS